jgi:hypothetical protein
MPEGPLVRVDARGLIIASPAGELTDALLTECCRQIHSSPEFATGIPVLIDLSKSTSVVITTDQIVALATVAQKDTNRVAIIATNPAAYGMARMYEIIADLTDGRVAVFHTEAAALKWLYS